MLEVSLRLGAMMLTASGVFPAEAEARTALEAALADGRGLAKLREMIEAQGGDGRVCEDVSLLPRAARIVPVPSPADGYVVRMDTAALGMASQRLGAGRTRKEDAVDPAVGLVMAVELGQRVEAGAPLAYLHVGARGEEEAAALVRRAVGISPARAPVPPLVYAVVRPEGVERLA